MPSPYFAALVMAEVSTIVLSVVVLGSRRGRGRAIGPRGHLWFALSGAINGAGILALAFAIGRGNVTLAATLAATTPIWALAFGAVLFRRETLGIRHLAVALLVAIGGIVIVTR